MTAGYPKRARVPARKDARETSEERVEEKGGGGGRRARAKSPGKLVTLLTDRRLLKCPLKVLLLVASSRCDCDSALLRRRRRPHLGRHVVDEREREKEKERLPRSLFPRNARSKTEASGLFDIGST